MGIMNKRCHILISGKVQGVYYRAYAKTNAEKVRVTGYVKNMPDGRVEVVAEGDEFDVLSFIQFIRSGPPSSVIEGFDVEWLPASGEFKDFQVL